MEPDIIDFKTQHIKVLINDASATSKPHKNFMRTHIHHRDDVALSRKKRKEKKSPGASFLASACAPFQADRGPSLTGPFQQSFYRH